MKTRKSKGEKETDISEATEVQGNKRKKSEQKRENERLLQNSTGYIKFILYQSIFQGGDGI